MFGENTTLILCVWHWRKHQLSVSFQKCSVEVFQKLPMLKSKAETRKFMSLVKQFATSVMQGSWLLVPPKLFAEREIGQHHPSVKV